MFTATHYHTQQRICLETSNDDGHHTNAYATPDTLVAASMNVSDRTDTRLMPYTNVSEQIAGHVWV